MSEKDPAMLPPSTELTPVNDPPAWVKAIVDRHHAEAHADGRYTFEGDTVYFQADGSDVKVPVGSKE